MTRAAGAVAGVGLLLALIAALAAARPIFVETGDLKITFNAEVKPKTLPRSKRAPIAISLSGRVQGSGRTRIPAMTRTIIGIDKSLTVDARGVPACSSGQLENQTTEGAEAACAAAIVGSGSASVEIALGGGAPIQTGSRLLAFNGGIAGRTTTILIHAYLSTPVTQSIVVPVTLTKVSKGGYGLRALATVPTIASGAGSVSSLELTLKKRVGTAGGGKHGYLLARCSDGNFVFEPEVQFEDGNLARGLLAVGCNPSG